MFYLNFVFFLPLSKLVLKQKRRIFIMKNYFLTTSNFQSRVTYLLLGYPAVKNQGSSLNLPYHFAMKRTRVLFRRAEVPGSRAVVEDVHFWNFISTA